MKEEPLESGKEVVLRVFIIQFHIATNYHRFTQVKKQYCQDEIM